MKTNKSFTKRLRITKNGKMIARKSGQNHFRARHSANVKMNKRRTEPFHMANKAIARFIPSI